MGHISKYLLLRFFLDTVRYPEKVYGDCIWHSIGVGGRSIGVGVHCGQDSASSSKPKAKINVFDVWP